MLYGTSNTFELSDYDLVEQSGYFDKSWYLRNNADVARLGLNPIEHFLLYGAKELRDPSQKFSVQHYLKEHPDIRDAGLNPLLHYLRFGQLESRHIYGSIPEHVWWRSAQARQSQSGPLAPGVRRVVALATEVVVVINVTTDVSGLAATMGSLKISAAPAKRIVLFNGSGEANATLAAIAANAGLGDIEIYKGGFGDGSVDILAAAAKVCAGGDLVLLRPGALPPQGWLTNLRVVAYGGDKVAAVSPAVASLAPGGDWLEVDGGPAPGSPIEMARMVRQAAVRTVTELKSLAASCAFIRNEFLAVALDAARAGDVTAPWWVWLPQVVAEKGGRCLLDDATLLFDSALIGDETREEAAKEDGVLEYAAKANAVVTRVAAMARMTRSSAKPRVLFVMSPKAGGTYLTNRDLMTVMGDRVETFVLYRDADSVTLAYFHDGVDAVVESWNCDQGVEAFPHRNMDYATVVGTWLVRYGIDLAHFRHIAWHPLDLIPVAKALGVKTIFSFHDFYTLCPTVNLLDEKGVYCAGQCTTGAGDCPVSIWPQNTLPLLKHAGVFQWRRQIGEALALCDAFVTTSAYAKRLLVSHYPFLGSADFRLIPHGRDFSTLSLPRRVPGEGEPIRLLLPGNISVSKGALVAEALATMASEVGLEIHVLGSMPESLKAHPAIIYHGGYQRGDFAQKVETIAPHLGAVLSTWPETYCHTLTEMWASGLPVIGFDFGEVGERIRQSGAGWLTDAPTADAVLAILKQLRADPALLQVGQDRVAAWQRGEARTRDLPAMGHAYFDLYRDVLGHSAGKLGPRPRIAVISRPDTHDAYQGVDTAHPQTARNGSDDWIADGFERQVRFDRKRVEDDADLLAEAYDGVVLRHGSAPDDRLLKILRGVKSRRRAVVYCADAYPPNEVARTIAREADLVLTSNEALRQRLFPLNPQVVMEAEVISPHLWFSHLPDTHPAVREEHRPRSADEVRTVWVDASGDPALLDLIGQACERVRETVPNLRVFLVGPPTLDVPWAEVLTPPPGLDRNHPEVVAWLRAHLRTMSFGIAPLREGGAEWTGPERLWLLYAAAGLACVASDVPPYTQSIRRAMTGHLARNTVDAWANLMIHAASDPRGMQEIALRARRLVSLHRNASIRAARFDCIVGDAIKRVSEASG